MSISSFFKRKKRESQDSIAPQPVISGVRELSFRYRSGGSDVRYALEQTADGYLATVRLEGESADDAVTVPVGEDIADEIAGLLNDYDVMRWDGYHESERGVLNSDRFSFSVYFAEGSGISADGYMTVPENYDEVSEGLDEIFRRVRDSALSAE